ncbi:MAG: VacJ family lipoprotein [Rhodobacteraceae bacterium]|nr:VacJ family lipoprotein [Paracoccaceae bacterium]
MTVAIPLICAAPVRKLAVIAALAALTACGPAPAPTGIDDPYERENRGTHQFNLMMDQKVLSPLSQAMGSGNGPISRGISNFGGNLGLPGDVVNNLLQFRIGRATHNTLRFAINSTIGIAGLFDPATAVGVPAKETDFGETLHVWGIGEGAYLELPLLGPSTQRDALGSVVDLALDPVNHLVPKPESYIGTMAKLAARLGDRARYSATVDSILYGSADSYAQARLLYLQNRRYELGQTTGEGADFEDPYEDPYGE